MTTTDILTQVKCDNCGKVLHNCKGGHWFKTEDEALGTARQYGWRMPGGKHICYDCFRQLKRRKQ